MKTLDKYLKSLKSEPFFCYEQSVERIILRLDNPELDDMKGVERVGNWFNLI